MTPNVLIVHPDLALAARLRQLILSGNDTEVGFGMSVEDGLMVLRDYTHLDLCLCDRNHFEEEGSALLATLKERFPRARLIVVSDSPIETDLEGNPNIVFLSLPLDEARFIFLCQETFASLHGCLLSHFRLGTRFHSDRWSDWYEAYDNVLKREIYVSVTHAWAAPKELALFLNIATLRAQATHNDVQSVYLAGNHEGRSFVCHEKWTMPHLKELAADRQKISARLAARIIHTAGSVLMFWDEHSYPHPPLNGTHLSLSPAGVVKVKNCIDPTLPFKSLERADLIAIAEAIQALLPHPAEVPLPLRELLQKIKANHQVVFETSLGDIVVELFNAEAPNTVANFLNYVDRNAYDGTLFHHIVSGFVAQGGRYTGEMTKMPTDAPIHNEASPEFPNLRGTLAMARNENPHSSTSQFFFNLKDNSSLNGKLGDPGCTVFGKIIRGIDVIEKMAQVEVTRQDRYYLPVKPVTLFKVRRKAATPVAEIVAEAKTLDAQLSDGTMVITMPRRSMKATASGWLKSMTSTDKALSTISKAINKISAPHKK